MTSTVDMWRPMLKLILNLHVSHPELPTNPVTKASTYSSFYISIGNGNLCILSLTDVTSRTYDILILFFTCPPNSMGSCHYHPDDYHMFRSCPFFVPRPPAARLSVVIGSYSLQWMYLPAVAAFNWISPSSSVHVETRDQVICLLLNCDGAI